MSADLVSIEKHVFLNIYNLRVCSDIRKNFAVLKSENDFRKWPNKNLCKAKSIVVSSYKVS